jgi:hypothetical protein
MMAGMSQERYKS